MNLKLKFRILKFYGTQAVFGAASGLGENLISRTITGRQTPAKQEKELICRKLKIKNPEDYFK